ncbi:hypothetical protein K490DRAFT_52677 [Saccharata proteae CBS 121410]|uniref:Uncharacterized protein n=1 Tax=Saccharata proteae CBS 121410 TaxID=1314787 RepID=A0A9P4LZT7_9PEZI|nr:hypothetical protein K490DRAFT_52677 [Saccharata proteae CBS 121410]
MCVIENRIYVFNTGIREIYEHKRLCHRAVGNMPCQWTTKEERILPAGRPPHSPRLSSDHDPLPSPTSSSGFPPTPPDGVALAARPGSRRGSSSSPQGRKQFIRSRSHRYVKPELIINMGNSKPKDRARPKDRRYHHGSTMRTPADEIAVYDPPSPVSSTVAETGFMDEDERRPLNYVTTPTRRQSYATRPVAPPPKVTSGHVRTSSRRSAFTGAGESDALAPPPPPNGPPRPPAPPAPADPPSPQRIRAFPPIVTGPHQAQNVQRSAPPLVDVVYETRSTSAKDKQRADDSLPRQSGESKEARLARIERERSDHRQKMRDQKRADEWQARYDTARAAAREQAREAKRRSQGSPDSDWEKQLQEGRERLERLKMTETQPSPQPQRPTPTSASASGANWEDELRQGRERVERDRQQQAARNQEAQRPPPSPQNRAAGFDRIQPDPRASTRNAGPSRTRSTRVAGDRHHQTPNPSTSRRARQQQQGLDSQDYALLLAAEQAQLRRERLAADLAEQEENDRRRAAMDRENEIRAQEAEVDRLEKQLWQRRRRTDYNPRSGMRAGRGWGGGGV